MDLIPKFTFCLSGGPSLLLRRLKGMNNGSLVWSAAFLCQPVLNTDHQIQREALPPRGGFTWETGVLGGSAHDKGSHTNVIQVIPVGNEDVRQEKEASS